MEKECVGCRSPKVESSCGICSAALCRKCRVFLSEEEFPYLDERPADLKHTFYCASCDDEKLTPFREEYESTVAKAKDVTVLFKGSKSTVRILKRAKEKVEVRDCVDRDITILRLAYLAVREGYDSLVEVEVEFKKVRMEGWQTTAWFGQGLPADVKGYRNEE